MERDGTPALGSPTALGLRKPCVTLPSRQAALATCRNALRLGPVLITGEAGSGKTCLAAELSLTADPSWRWIAVDLAPRMSPAEFLGAIVHALGLAPLRDVRFAIRDHLTDSARDRTRWALTIEEAHLASQELLEEIRLLTNRQGEPDGFESIVIVAQTTFVRRLATPALSALETRLAAHVHLLPLPFEETRQFVEAQATGLALHPSDLELLHRDARGNLRRLHALVSEWTRRRERSTHAASVPEFAPAPVVKVRPEPAASTPPVSAPPILNAKPPLHMEDGVIEVGWDAEPDVRISSEPVSPAGRGTARGQEGAPAEESVDDHYAALQAWNEWASNQGRRVIGTTASIDAVDWNPDADSTADSPETLPSPTTRVDSTQVWAEGQQSFAPYSQLFSRARQAKDSER